MQALYGTSHHPSAVLLLADPLVSASTHRACLQASLGRSLCLWLLIISPSVHYQLIFKFPFILMQNPRGCLRIFLPLVKRSLLASHCALFSYLLLLFTYYNSGSREKFCIKMKGNLKNELVMRAINQSSLQPRQHNGVCWCEGARVRGLMRNEKQELLVALMRQLFA